ncbi:glycosyltransferase family 2 protein [Pannonibacter carbonis]|uniref:glycosyltransferase family 2 protein n=1 Tax=Pannonibacter carbonis TaxID=2067569 RepID=UPI000D10F1D5|nr:glycosyltransferase family 2 protein [Pannonibacter carbonis]
MGGTAPELSVVIPCFNEAANLVPLMARLVPVLEGLGHSFEILLVDDGSRDRTLEVASGLAAADPRIGILSLSRNFGKEIAITAGIDHARGKAAILIDADLQHPPEKIIELVAAWNDGFQIIHATQTVRPSEGLAKRAGANLFYKLLAQLSDIDLPRGAGDFCLLDRAALDALKSMPERARFMKGLYFWVGFRQKQIPYEPAERLAGASGWCYRRLASLALNGLTAFSTVPLRLASIAGLLVSIIAIIYGLVLMTDVLLHGIDVPGYASLMVGLLFLSGVQLISLGILGEYVGRIFNETKQRPLYFVGSYRPATPNGPDVLAASGHATPAATSATST